MNQQELWYATPESALRAVVDAIGPKAVAQKLKPTKPIEYALTWLDDALNPRRKEKLGPDQVLLILKWGRQIGCHVAMHFMNVECGYAVPVAVEPEDEQAKLRREFIEATKRLENLSKQIGQADERVRLRAVESGR